MLGALTYDPADASLRIEQRLRALGHETHTFKIPIHWVVDLAQTVPTKETFTMNKAEQLKARLKREDELRPIIEAYIAGKPVWWRDTSRTKRWEQSQIDDGPSGLGFLPSFASIQYRLTPPPPEKLTVTLELTPGEALALLSRLNVTGAAAEQFVDGARSYAGCPARITPAEVYASFWERKDSLAEQLAAFLRAQD